MDKPGEPAILFVYGSLLNAWHRQQIIGRRVDTVPATLHDFERGRGRYFYIRRRPGLSTHGLLLLNLTPRDFRLLDQYEETPQLYTRETVEVIDDNSKPARCWVYLPTQSALARC